MRATHAELVASRDGTLAVEIDVEQLLAWTWSPPSSFSQATIFCYARR